MGRWGSKPLDAAIGLGFVRDGFLCRIFEREDLER
jgi:hypothetical protein